MRAAFVQRRRGQAFRRAAGEIGDPDRQGGRRSPSARDIALKFFDEEALGADGFLHQVADGPRPATAVPVEDGQVAEALSVIRAMHWSMLWAGVT